MPTPTADTSFWPTPGTVPVWGIPVPAANVAGMNVAGDPGPGSRRGLVIFAHPSLLPDPAVPIHLPSSSLTNGFTAIQEFASTGSPTNAAAQGWVTWYPPQPVDFSLLGTGYPLHMATMVVNDTSHGALLTTVYQRWFLKQQRLAMKFYGLASPPPTIICGFSLGAWAAAVVAANLQSNIIGYFCHALPTLWDQLYLGPLGTEWLVFQGVNCTGINLSTTYLQGVTVPGVIGHSESVTLSAVSLAGASLSVTTSSTPTWVNGTAVTIGGAAGGTWGTAGTSGQGINGTWNVTSGSGTSWVLNYTNGGTAPSGGYTSGSAYCTPAGVFTDGVVGWTGGTTPPSNGSAIVASAGNAINYIAPENGVAYPNAHLFGLADAQFYANWIGSTFNGTHPAFF